MLKINRKKQLIFFGNNNLNIMKKLLLLVVAMTAILSAYAQYKVGDIYNANGLKGLVVDVDASGKHGLILSLEESDKDWIEDETLALETNASMKMMG